MFCTCDTEFDGIEVHSCVVFNTRDVKTAGLTSEDFSGPTVSFPMFPFKKKK